MSDPATVAAALARLAARSSPSRQNYRTVVADAETAFRDVEAAAEFVDAGGESRLRDAVDAARRRGDDDLADRGETLLETLAGYREAAAPGQSGGDDQCV